VTAAATAFVVLVLVGGAALLFGGEEQDTGSDAATGDTLAPITTLADPVTAVGQPTSTEPSSTPSSLQWASVGLDPADSVIELYGVTSFGDRWLAVGLAAGPDEMADGAILLSENGTDWNRIAEDQTALTDEGVLLIGGISPIDTGVVALGGYVCLNPEEPCGLHPAVWFSPDGHAWEQVPDNPAVFGSQGWIADAVQYQDRLLAVGLRFDDPAGAFTPTVWSSPDGLTWTLAWTGTPQPVLENQATPLIEGKPYSLMEAITTTSSGELVAVGSTCDTSTGQHECAATVWTSNNGETWTQTVANASVFASNQPGGHVVMTDITEHDGQLVAVGTDNGTTAAAWTSTDGLTWTHLELPEEMTAFGELSAIVTMNGTLTAAGPGWAGQDTNENVSFWTTTNGTTWTLSTQLEPGSVQTIIPNGNTGIAVGLDTANNTAAIWTTR